MRTITNFSSLILFCAFGLQVSPALADNPIVQHIYTADPAPMVYEDAVWLCASHDEDVTIDGFFTMDDWAVFSSKDMVNWTDHGTPLSWETFSWAKANKSWAPQCIARNNKFYFFVPVDNRIGVAVADSPVGPFTDAIGGPLVDNYQYIDPTVFIDDDGQAYLYFGNPRLWYVKLNEDMISFEGDVQQISNTTESFGSRPNGGDRPTRYEEGPWFYKRKDLYYMIFAAGALPEKIDYSTSPGPMGPWTYQGEIMPSQNGHAFTNHAGVVDYKGRSFFFYHTQELPGGDGYKRSVAVEEFTYNADGSIPSINKTREGVTESVEPLIPYYRVEGETIAWEEGIETEACSEGGRNVSEIDDGDYIKVEQVDFLTGALSFEASVASAGAGGSIELHLDAKDGELLGTCSVSPTGDWQSWQIVSCDVTTVSGIHDLFLVFKGNGGPLFNLDWYQFTPVDPLPEPGTGGSDAGTGGGGPGTGGGAPGAGGGLPGSGGAGVGGAGVGTGGTGGAGVGTGGAGAASTGGTAPANRDEAAADGGFGCVMAPRAARTPWGWLALLGLGAASKIMRRRRV